MGLDGCMVAFIIFLGRSTSVHEVTSSFYSGAGEWRLILLCKSYFVDPPLGSLLWNC